MPAFSHDSSYLIAKRELSLPLPECSVDEVQDIERCDDDPFVSRLVSPYLFTDFFSAETPRPGQAVLKSDSKYKFFSPPKII